MHRKYTNRILMLTFAGRGPALRDDPATGGGDTSGSGTGNTGTGDADKDGDKSGDSGAKPKIKGDFDPDRAAADLGKARDDAKREKELRLKAEQDSQAKLDAVLIGLGIKPDPKTDPAATVAKVAKELEDAQKALTETRIENAILKLAGKVGADAAALQDSRSFMKELGELDPAAKDFDESVTAAIKAAVKANPKLAVVATQGGQGPARQGADITGSGGAGGTRPTSLSAALAATRNK